MKNIPRLSKRALVSAPGPISWPERALAPVFRAGRFTQNDRDFTREHVTPHLTIHLFSLPGRVRIGEHTIDLAAGDLTVTPPDTAERFDLTGTGLHWCIRVQPDASCPGKKLALDFHHRLGTQALEARRRIEFVIQDLRTAAGDETHPAALAAAAGTQALLCWLAGRQRLPPALSHADICVQRALALLGSTECAAIPIAEIAQRAGMSRNRLAQAFLARHGVTMVQYRARRMMESAQWLMEASDLTMAQIRSRIEVDDPHRFNKRFRQLTGMSPRAWLKHHEPVMNSSPRPPTPARRRKTP